MRRFQHEWNSSVYAKQMTSRIGAFLHDENGPTSVEYAVLLALIIAICIVSIRTLGNHQTGMWGATVTKLNAAGFISN